MPFMYNDQLHLNQNCPYILYNYLRIQQRTLNLTKTTTHKLVIYPQLCELLKNKSNP